MKAPHGGDAAEQISRIEKLYKEWCKETKRNGGVLIGNSIHEFFKYLASAPSVSQVSTAPVSDKFGEFFRDVEMVFEHVEGDKQKVRDIERLMNKVRNIPQPTEGEQVKEEDSVSRKNKHLL